MGNLIIGMGNTGTQIVKLAAQSELLSKTSMYVIDSQASQIDMDTVTRITTIPIVTDDKCGSGRSRERGKTMFDIHKEAGDFNELVEEALNSLSPVIVITSSAGGTGSGSTPSMCALLKEKGIYVIPIIICPALKDPDAFHLNTNDLMMDLQSIGIETYAVFRNEFGKADYSDINAEVVQMIEIIFGKYYDNTDKATIDASDLDVILSVPGRFIAITVESESPEKLAKVVTSKVFNCHQPAWTTDDIEKTTLVKAFALTSPCADSDFESVFAALNERISHSYDEYRNVCNKDGRCRATVIVSGLPRAELRNIDSEFMEAGNIADGVQKSSRPAFLQKKGGVRTTKTVKGFNIQ